MSGKQRRQKRGRNSEDETRGERWNRIRIRTAVVERGVISGTSAGTESVLRCKSKLGN
jgi:hypothetical protein